MHDAVEAQHHCPGGIPSTPLTVNSWGSLADVSENVHYHCSIDIAQHATRLCSTQRSCKHPQVLDVYWRGRELWGIMEVLPTPAGLLLWELYSKVSSKKAT